MQKARLAVALFFFTNGFTFANWVGRIPTIKDKHNLNDADLGIILLGGALGSLVTLPTTGWLIARFGGRLVAAASGLGYSLVLVVIAAAPSPLTLWLALFLAGVLTGAMDVAMNAQGVLVENTYHRSIMLSFHAMFSIGGLVGAGVAALLAEISVAQHFAIASTAMVAVILGAAPFLLPNPPLERRTALARPSRGVLLLGVIIFASALTEGAMADWSATYLKDDLGSSARVAALGFAGFSLGMTLGRLTGDRVTNRFGPVRVVRLGGILTTLGLALAVVVATPVVVIIGFSAVGLGVSSVFPLVFSAAGRTPGLSPSAGLAAVATIGYFGFLAGPPVIGFVAEATSLRVDLALVLVLTMLIAANAHAVQRAAFSSQRTQPDTN